MNAGRLGFLNDQKRWLAGLAAAGVVTAAGVAWAGNHAGGDHSHGDSKQAPPDIVDTAVQAGSFQTLAAALDAAGLVETLKGDGPFTVFAPTDEAFAKLPEGTVATLLKPENKDTLVDILTLHVVPGDISAVDAIKAEQAEAVNGDDLAFTIKKGRVQVNGIDVIDTDIGTANGVIHVVDEVILPEQSAQQSNAATGAMPVRLIDRAISRGAPLYNHGNARACAAVYEVALLALADHDGVSRDLRRMASRAVERGEGMHDHDARAWAYRRALDKLRGEMTAGDAALARRGR